MFALLTVIVLAAPTMTHGVATTHSGCVIAAPHEGFDSHTAAIAKSVGEDLGWGWVVASDYRSSSAKRWFDVNRPTQKLYVRGQAGPARPTDEGLKVYEEYQRRVFEAAVEGQPLDLLVEIHGHARAARIEGEAVTVQVIELATIGFSDAQLLELRTRYEVLVGKLPEEGRVALAVEQLEPVYAFRGVEVPFYFRASGAKTTGSMRPSCAKRALHFELPRKVRFDPELRKQYATLFTLLLRPLTR